MTETAAEKLVALTRRIAMELAGLSRDPDPTLVRHIYDLHLMQGHIDPVEVADARPRYRRGRRQGIPQPVSRLCRRHRRRDP